MHSTAPLVFELTARFLKIDIKHRATRDHEPGRFATPHRPSLRAAALAASTMSDSDSSLDSALLEKMAKDLGPHAAKIQQLISAIQ